MSGPGRGDRQEMEGCFYRYVGTSDRRVSETEPNQKPADAAPGLRNCAMIVPG